MQRTEVSIEESADVAYNKSRANSSKGTSGPRIRSAASDLINGSREEIKFPQGLNPFVYGARIGTARAVPFQIGLMRPVLSWKRGTR